MGKQSSIIFCTQYSRGASSGGRHRAQPARPRVACHGDLHLADGHRVHELQQERARDAPPGVLCVACWYSRSVGRVPQDLLANSGGLIQGKKYILTKQMNSKLVVTLLFLDFIMFLLFSWQRTTLCSMARRSRCHTPPREVTFCPCRRVWTPCQMCSHRPC